MNGKPPAGLILYENTSFMDFPSFGTQQTRHTTDSVDGSKFDGFLTVATSWLSFKCMSAALLSYVSGVWQSGIDCFFLSEPEQR